MQAPAPKPAKRRGVWLRAVRPLHGTRQVASHDAWNRPSRRGALSHQRRDDGQPLGRAQPSAKHRRLHAAAARLTRACLVAAVRRSVGKGQDGAPCNRLSHGAGGESYAGIRRERSGPLFRCLGRKRSGAMIDAPKQSWRGCSSCRRRQRASNATRNGSLRLGYAWHCLLQRVRVAFIGCRTRTLRLARLPSPA